MKRNMKNALRGLACVWCVTVASAAHAVTIWEGPDLTVTNPPNGGVQDAITPNVVLTRASSEGLYNAALETGYDRDGKTSPAGTRWAFLGLDGNPADPAQVTASNHTNLNFSEWAASLGDSPNLLGNIQNRPGVVHLITDDIYLDIMFTNWGGGGTGGAFTYIRSTEPAPLPGDTDGDGDVDDADLGTAFSNYTGPLDPGVGTKTAEQGDTDGDGDGDDADLGTAFAGYTGPLGTASAPEPASIVILAIGFAIARRRRSSRTTPFEIKNPALSRGA